MKKSWYNIVAEGKTAKVDMRGYIGDWGVTDQSFIADVQAAGEVDQIDVTINSRGGQIDHALAIFNFLRSHPAKVNMRIDGVAMSAATIVMMAGDTISAPANAVIMMHKPLDVLFGYYNADELRKQADVLDVFQKALMETYKARTGKSDAELNAIMDAETFWTATEAKDQGFIDEVIPLKSKASAAGMAAMAMASALDIPADVLARAEAQAEASAPADVKPAPPAIDPAPKTPQATFAEQVKAAAHAAGLPEFAAYFAVDAGLPDMAAVNAALADAREIRDLCNLVDMADQSAPLIRSRSTLDKARAALADALAKRDAEAHADTKQPLPNKPVEHSAGEPVNTASIWQKRQAVRRAA